MKEERKEGLYIKERRKDYMKEGRMVYVMDYMKDYMKEGLYEERTI